VKCSNEFFHADLPAVGRDRKEKNAKHTEDKTMKQSNNGISRRDGKPKMKKIIITLSFIILLSLAEVNFAQNSYSVQPGVKNNQIVLELSNISSTEPATDLEVKLVRNSKHLKFVDEEKSLESLTQNTKSEIPFTFDVEYNIGKTEADTVEFMITDNKSIYLTKQFILEYSTPTEYKLEQNYPNPFNPTTKIRYSIPNVETHRDASVRNVTLKVYDILGNEITTLVNEQKEPGYYEVEFNASQFASGVYIYRLISGQFVSTKKMLMIK
jgi:hypothetical protein